MIGYVSVLFFIWIIYSVIKLIRHYEHGNLSASQIGTRNPVKPIRTAVVLGGSMAGLLTAKCLSDHANKVIIVERKRMRDTTGSIAIHGSFTHIFLNRGYEIACKLFPGLEKELENNDNVIPIDWGCDMDWVAEGKKMVQLPRGAIGWMVKAIQRNFLENILRNRVLSLSNVEIQDGMKFLNYIMIDSNRITGITCVKDGEDYAVPTTIAADLVIDCMGLVSPTVSRLAKLGHIIETTKVNCNLHYLSQLYKQPEELKFPLRYYQPYAPDATTGALLMPYSKGVTIATLISYNKSPLPRDQKEVNEYYQRFPAISDYLSKCTPISEISSYRKEGNELRHFEKINLDGFIALGDSVCNFNPVFGQGQTTAAEQVLILDTLLRDLKQGEKLSCKRFQERAKAVLSVPFALAAFSDLRFPKTETNSTILRKLAPIIAYPLKKILLDSSKSTWTYRCFTQVLHMRQGYIWTFADPKLLWNILTL